MEHVVGFVNVPDLYHCLSPCFRKLVSAILPLLYSHLSKKVRDLYAAMDVQTWVDTPTYRYMKNV